MSDSKARVPRPTQLKSELISTIQRTEAGLDVVTESFHQSEEVLGRVGMLGQKERFNKTPSLVVDTRAACR